MSRSRESSRYVILEGEFLEPLSGATKFLLQLSPQLEPSLGGGDIPSVGSVIQVKTQVQAVVTLTPDEFHYVFLLASSGKLLSVYMAVQEPYYGRALIASMSFSSRPPASE
jgi:hypothetical protein